MTPLLHDLSLLSAAASGALLSAVWEGAILAAGVFLCLRLLPSLSATARSVIWLNVFVLLVLLHFVPAITRTPETWAPQHAPALHLDWRWSLALLGVWVAMSAWRAFHLAAGALHLHRLARSSRPVASVDPELAAILHAAPEGRGAQLCLSDDVARPSVLGFFHPRVLVPTGLIEILPPSELRQVVLHEMEHLRRADDWTNLLQKIGLVLFPLNPVLLWVERRLCAERELACDDRVLQTSSARKAYALCLTHLAEFGLLRRSFSLVLGAFERRSELVGRVHRILQQPHRTMSRRAALATTGSLLTGALGCALALAHSPQLVSFSPSFATGPQLAASLDPQALGHALGGTPRLVKATMPAPSSGSVTHLGSQMPRKGMAHAKPRRAASTLTASLAPATRPNPVMDSRIGDQNAAIVLTEFRAWESTPRVVLTVSPQGHTGDSQHPRPVLIPARYAVVQLPNGWLIIQI